MAAKKTTCTPQRRRPRRGAARTPISQDAFNDAEARFRSLTELSLDWFWEQDAALRFTRFEGTHVTGDNAAFHNELGKTREEMGVEVEGGWDAHHVLLEAHQPFRDVVMWRTFQDRQRHYMSVSGEPLFDAAGCFLGYRGVGKDITARKREEQLLALEHAVNRCLGDAENLSTALQTVLRAVCESKDWECGRYYTADKNAGLLRYTEGWGIADPAVERYLAAARERVLPVERGLKGRAYCAREPMWGPDKGHHENLAKTHLGGARDTFMIPAIAEGTVIGMLCFTNRVLREPDARLMQAARVIGSQIGQFVQRKRAEEAQRRFRAAMDASADLMLLIDPTSLRYIDVNDAACRALGYSREELLAMGPLDIFSESREELARTYEHLIAGEPSEAAVEGWYRCKDGSRLGVEAIHRVLRSAEGAVIVSVAREIAERRRAEQLLRLEHTVNRALADTESVGAGLKAALRAVCETEAWDCGRYLQVDEAAGVLRYREDWGIQNEDVERFLTASRKVTYARGEGLAGRAWQTGQLVWAADVSNDQRAKQGGFLKKIGIRGAIFFQVLSEGKTIGILSFHSREVREPEERLLQAMRVIGSQVGQFVQRKRAEEEQRRFRAAMDASADLMLLIDPTRLRYIDVNDAACRALGYTREELLTMGPPDIFSKSGEELARLYERMLAGDVTAPRVEGVYRCKDGSQLPIEASVRAVRSAAGDMIVSIARDVRERRRAEQLLALEHAVARNLADAESLPAGLKSTLRAICETEGWDCARYLRVDEPAGVLCFGEAWSVPNARIERYLEESRSVVYSPGDGLMGLVWQSGEPLWVSDTSNDARTKRKNTARETGLHAAVYFPVVSGEKTIGLLAFNSREIREPDARLLQSMRVIGSQIGQFHQRKQAEKDLLFIATHDPLTLLPNRGMFNERLDHALAQARCHDNKLAILFIDLDRFKNINDTLGHDAGDRLLQEMARRLSACLRESDTVARQGGDEFIILLEELSDPQHAAQVAAKILSVVATPVLLNGQEYHVTASIGISTFPNDGQDGLALLKNADSAMYRAKDLGKNNFQFYSAQMNLHSLERLEMEARLRGAFERNEFLLYYQPKVDMRTGRINGVEALIRWQHPEKGLVPPMQFIPLAEETGLIVPIGRWVLQTACAQSQAWQQLGLAPVRIAINLSPRQFADEKLLHDIENALTNTGLDPAYLELEITESMVMRDPEQAVEVLSALSAMGLRIAIDDFGTGYSSLSLLKRFPIDDLKIDPSFIKDIPADGDDVAITRAIIAMAHSLRLCVVAEGVETVEQLDFLRQNGCDDVQGYYFSKPLPEKEIIGFLHNNRHGVHLPFTRATG